MARQWRWLTCLDIARTHTRREFHYTGQEVEPLENVGGLLRGLPYRPNVTTSGFVPLLLLLVDSSCFLTPNNPPYL